MTDISTTGERQPSRAKDEIIREAQRLEESTLYSFKGHHCATSGWAARHLWLGIPTIVISTVVGAAAFSKYSNEYPWVAVVGSALSVAVAVLSAISTFLNPNEKENAHFSAAHGYDKLNNDSRLFWSVDCWQEDSDLVLTTKLRELVDRKNELNSSSPQIPNWAYRKAKKGIEEGESSFRVDKVVATGGQTTSLPSNDGPQPAASEARRVDS